MSPEKAFNNKILELLSKSPNSSASEVIKRIEKKYLGNKNYYSIFDSFGHQIGLNILSIPLVNEKDENLGYLPHLKYFPDNLLSEEPRTECLVNKSSPMPLNECYAYLAKEFVYRIMRINNLNQILD